MGRKSTGIVERIKAELLIRLSNGTFTPERALPGAMHLADEFGCSYVTMNRALDELVKTHYLVRRRGAGTFALKQKHRIAYFAWTPQNFGFIRCIPEIYNHAAHEALAAYGCEVVDFSYKQLVDQYFVPVLLRNFDGILCSSAYTDRKSVKLVMESKLPLVFFGPYKTIPQANFVIANWQHGLRELFTHISHAETKTFWIWDCPINGNQSNVALEILTATAALRIPKENVVIQSVKKNKMQSMETSAYELCKTLNAPADIIHISTSDLLAFGIYNAFLERGYPAGDFELMSCDDLESRGIMPYPTPQITSINHPKEELARRAVKLLMDLLISHDQALFTIEVPTSLTIRKSGLYKMNKK